MCFCCLQIAVKHLASSFQDHFLCTLTLLTLRSFTISHKSDVIASSMRSVSSSCQLIAAMVLLVCLLLCAPCNAATPVSQYGNLSVVADGYVWIENIWVNPNSNLSEQVSDTNSWALFFSDSFRGEAVRVSRGAQGNYNTQLWLTGFYRVLGFAPSPNASELFAVGWTTATQYNIIAFSVNTPQQWRIVATTPLGGNGLGFDPRTQVLFTATEGEFIPTNGFVYSMNMSGVLNSPSAQSAPAVFDFGLTAADGLWVDGDARLLYVSEVLNATIRRYNLTNAAPNGGRAALINSYHAPGLDMLDDFSVTASFCQSGTSTMFGADFWAGKVFAFSADGSRVNATELVSGLYSPTSVRYATKQDGTRSLFISEGGGIDEFMNNRRLWELTLDARFQC